MGNPPYLLSSKKGNSGWSSAPELLANSKTPSIISLTYHNCSLYIRSLCESLFNA